MFAQGFIARQATGLLDILNVFGVQCIETILWGDSPVASST